MTTATLTRFQQWSPGASALRVATFALVALLLALAGCSSTAGSSATAGYAAVDAAKVDRRTATRTVRTARRDVRKAKRDQKALEKRIARDERRVKRNRGSKRRIQAARKRLRTKRADLRKARRIVRTAERNLARAERKVRSADRAIRSAQRRARAAERREAAAKAREAAAARSRDSARERAQARLARAEAKQKKPPVRTRITGLFATSDPALKFVSDYKGRTDGGFALAEIPIQKLDKRLYRQQVRYRTREKPGTVIVDTGARYLYLVQPGGRAMRYGIGVGREGFAWSGSAHIGWKAAWPKWTPPAEMIERRPELEKWSAENGGMPGGVDNPLGARALYLVANGQDTLYRLHGTPQWNSIGTAASSGCIRLINQDVIDLYNRVPNGAKVVVL